MRDIQVIAVVLLATALPMLALADADPAITECDRLAAHPEDPDHIGIGVPTQNVDLPAAVIACRAELERQPDNQRIRYQYARVLAYTGQWDASALEMKKAADAGYRQAQFVYGLFIGRGRPGMPRDACLAGEYWLKAAHAGRQAARVQYAHEYLDGNFNSCQESASIDEVRSVLAVAAAEARDFYERMLISDLQKRAAESGGNE
jgi:hypothetical protein